MSKPIISALIGNAQHPEYGVATIPFPLSREEYDHSIEMLSALEIGDAIKQDCRVDAIKSEYPILKRLEGQTVNVDELDYLAKRLDGFSEGEVAQFQCMAVKMGTSNIKDFINLTFCCQQVTVITDFSKLEQAGRDHQMNLNGGSMSSAEYNKIDGHMEALKLILNEDGYVTPYGVVYDNGMKLEQLYTGGAFPPYLYDTSPLVLEVLPLSEPEDPESGTLLCLPMTEKQLKRALARGGIESVDRMRLRQSLILTQELSRISVQQESMTDLNEVCEAIVSLDHNDRNKLGAAVTLAQPHSASQVKHLAENLELFEFIPKVRTPEEYGRHMIQESGHFEYDDNLEDFYDFEGYGRQRMSQELGKFVTNGYISYHGFLSLDEVMQDDPAEQYQKEQGFQMGGMQ